MKPTTVKPELALPVQAQEIADLYQRTNGLEELEEKRRPAHGGPRPNSGRKVGSKLRKTLEKEAARIAITKHLEPLIEAQVANALGIKYLVKRDKKTGKFTRVQAAAASPV
jgi:hypothetical protein